MAYKINIIIFCLVVFTVIPSYADIQMNGTLFGTNTAEIQVTNPVSVGSIEDDGDGIITTPIDGGELRDYSFDRINSPTVYSVYWTSISNTEIDFSVATLGLADARTTTTGSLLGAVDIDNVNTPFTFTPNLNTIIINTGKAIQEFFSKIAGGNSGGGGTPTNIPPSSTLNPSLNLTLQSVIIQGIPLTTVDSQIPFSWNTPDDITVSNISLVKDSVFSLRTSTPSVFNHVTDTLSQQSIPISVDIPSVCGESITDTRCINYGQYSIPVIVTFEINGQKLTGNTNINVNVVNQSGSQSQESGNIYLVYTGIIILILFLLIYFRKSFKITGTKRRKYTGTSRILNDSGKYDDYYKKFKWNDKKTEKYGYK